MMRLRSKVIEIEAILFTGDNVEEIFDEFGADGIYGPTEKNPDYLILTTLHEDKIPCRPGYWVVREPVPNRFYPCDPEVIERKYEIIDE
jgi:hypothetical protein